MGWGKTPWTTFFYKLKIILKPHEPLSSRGGGVTLTLVARPLKNTFLYVKKNLHFCWLYQWRPRGVGLKGLSGRIRYKNIFFTTPLCCRAWFPCPPPCVWPRHSAWTAPWTNSREITPNKHNLPKIKLLAQINIAVHSFI